MAIYHIYKPTGYGNLESLDSVEADNPEKALSKADVVGEGEFIVIADSNMNTITNRD